MTMCCEDYRIGFNSTNIERVKTMSGASEVVLTPNPERIAIIVYGTDAGTVHLSSLDPAVVGQGVHAGSSHLPVVMSVKDYGHAIAGQWFGISDMAGRKFSYAEIVSKFCRNDKHRE